MPIPQVNDRIKEAPVVVLRAVFAGIGQVLLTADKVRARAAEQVWTPPRAPAGLPADRRSPEPPRNGTTRTEPAVADHPAVREAPASQGPVPAPATKTTPATRAASAAKTGPATKASPPAKARPTAKTAPPVKATPTAKATPAAKTAPKTQAPRVTETVPAPRAAKAEPAPEAPPLPGYDDLSLASLRGRLRVLDAATIQATLAYEKAHARREPVITMLERRLAKISAG
jgi:hypothetical protein